MIRTSAALAAVLTLALASQAWAQRGGGGGGGGGGFGPGVGEFGRQAGIDWIPSIDAALGRGGAAPTEGGAGGDAERADRRARRFMGFDPVPKKYVFVYIRTPMEDRDPATFNNTDIIQASWREWAFVKMDFDKEQANQKAWGIRGAPVCLTLDLHGNDILRANVVSVEAVRGLLRNTPDEILRFEAKLKVDFQRALEALKTDEARGVKGLIDIAALNRVGYKEITDAQSALVETSEATFKNCDLMESVGPEQAIAYLEEMVRLYKLTSPGVRAEVRIARMENLRENVAAALQRIQKVSKYDARFLRKEIEEAQALAAEIAREGEAKISAALTGNRAEARESLRKIAREYSGTEAGRRAADEARKLD
jgi:hypothetical protein